MPIDEDQVCGEPAHHYIEQDNSVEWYCTFHYDKLSETLHRLADLGVEGLSNACQKIIRRNKMG